jgi:hypothetical protein
MAAQLGCGDSEPSKAPYDAHLENDVCIGDLHGCPATFDQVPCTAALGEVGQCNGNHLIYTYAETLPGMIGDYPRWLCFYDATGKQLIGQRVCVDKFILCGGSHMCADTPSTPYCDDFLTTVAPPACR